MSFSQIWAVSQEGALVITVPKKVAEQFNWKKGDQIWVPWDTIKENTDKHTHAAYRQSTGTEEDNYGKAKQRETRTSEDLPRRRRQRKDLEERDQRPGQAPGTIQRRHRANVQGPAVGRVQDNELVQTERPAEGGARSTEGVRAPRDAGRRKRRGPVARRV